VTPQLPIPTAPNRVAGIERRIRLSLGLTPEQVARDIWADPAHVLALEEGLPMEASRAEEIRWSLAARLALRLWHVWGAGYRRGDGASLTQSGGLMQVWWTAGRGLPIIYGPEAPDSRGPFVRRDVLLTMWEAQRSVPWSTPWREVWPDLCLACARTGIVGLAWCQQCHGNGCGRCGAGLVACPGCRP
jgi:hypothetical protein